uniref:Uncharacterized protein n=1 Tax=Pararge aegeria TaxID=116150 RepID=S4PZG4_9NEOP
MHRVISMSVNSVAQHTSRVVYKSLPCGRLTMKNSITLITYLDSDTHILKHLNLSVRIHRVTSMSVHTCV